MAEPKVCERCEERAAQHHLCNENPYRNRDCTEPECGGFLCSECLEPRDSLLGDYYGSSTPQTLDEWRHADLTVKAGR